MTSEFKDAQRDVWAAGDYASIAGLLEDAARDLVDACAVSAGQEMLDVAAGSGNAALAAAREGAAVVASDLTPAMLDLGRARAEAEGLDLEWVEADAELLPFEDGRFDCALSVFGAIFAPSPERVAAELFRVVRPGGTVGMANWTPGSFPARSVALAREGDAAAAPAVEEWGDEEIVRARLDGLAARVETERRVLRWQFPSVEAFAEHFERNAGSHARKRAQLGDAYGAYLERWTAIAREHARPLEAGGVEIAAEYLRVVARKRG